MPKLIEPVGWANSKDLVDDGFSHAFLVRSEQPGTPYLDGGTPVALYSEPLPSRRLTAQDIVSAIESSTGCPMLTSNTCAAVAKNLNKLLNR
jgi:hypothetical protein